MQEMVSSQVSEGQQNVSIAVQAAAEVNAQVILRHRAKLAEVSEAADTAKVRVLEMLNTVTETREVVALTAALEGWSRITKTVIDKEREAFNLNATDKPPSSYEQSLRELAQ
jgi:uncharacterized membrane protein YozB (DUF420 family)